MDLIYLRAEKPACNILLICEFMLKSLSMKTPRLLTLSEGDMKVSSILIYKINPTFKLPNQPQNLFHSTTKPLTPKSLNSQTTYPKTTIFKPSKPHNSLYSKSLVNFTSWLVIGFPIMVVDIFVAWFLILCLFVGFQKCFGREKVGFCLFFQFFFVFICLDLGSLLLLFKSIMYNFSSIFLKTISQKETIFG